MNLSAADFCIGLGKFGLSLLFAIKMEQFAQMFAKMFTKIFGLLLLVHRRTKLSKLPVSMNFFTLYLINGEWKFGNYICDEMD